MSDLKDIKMRLGLSTTLPYGSAGTPPSFLTGSHLHSHTHGPGCGCSGPVTDDEEEE